MSQPLDGNAIVYCEGAFNTTNGKTAHGLVRLTKRYDVLSVIDSSWSAKDAGEVLDGKAAGIPVLASLNAAIEDASRRGIAATHFIIGLAPDGGRLPMSARETIRKAIESRLHVVCGLHDYLTDDSVLVELAKAQGVTLTDIRKPQRTNLLHFFSGKIEEVNSFKVAILGTDSAVGKRTTAWKLVDGLNEAGHTAELVGTGQTAWLQGAKYGLILDSVVNDFLSGEIEHAVWTAWKEQKPEFLILEGQGSLLNPAYPGGFELIAAARPDAIVLQHAPARKEYDGFPGYRMHELRKQIDAVEMISDKKVIAITINHEGIVPYQIEQVCAKLEAEYNLPVADVLIHGTQEIVSAIVDARKRIEVAR